MCEENSVAIMVVSEINLLYSKADHVQFWAQIESNCELRGITKKKIPFRSFKANSRGGPGIIISPPAVNPYDTLRDKLIARTFISQRNKLSHHWGEQTIAIFTPSATLSRRKNRRHLSATRFPSAPASYF